jgi:DNA-binding transcriptional regulator YiaG
MHSGRMSVTADMVKSARTGLGESQAAFGERFGVNQSTVHRWETEGPPEGGAAGKAIERVLSELGVLAESARA